MTDRALSFRDPGGEEVACTRCGQLYDPVALDRLLWCEECRVAGRNQAGWWGWVIGVGFGGLVALYVFLVIRPTSLVFGGWIATLLAAVWIGAKLGREIVYGILRHRAGRSGGSERLRAADEV